MTDEFTLPKVEQVNENTTYIEFGLDYTDGARIVVGWSAEDNAWLARCLGGSAGVILADGQTKESALLALCCSISATLDAVNPDAKGSAA